jgi:hypothetical protein
MKQFVNYKGVGWHHHHSIITKISDYHHTKYILTKFNITWNKVKVIIVDSPKCCKDRFNNSVFLSPWLCTKRSVLIGWGKTQPTMCRRKDAKRCLASLLLEQIKISCYTEYKAFGPSLIYNKKSSRQKKSSTTSQTQKNCQ